MQSFICDNIIPKGFSLTTQNVSFFETGSCFLWLMRILVNQNEERARSVREKGEVNFDLSFLIHYCRVDNIFGGNFIGENV